MCTINQKTKAVNMVLCIVDRTKQLLHVCKYKLTIVFSKYKTLSFLHNIFQIKINQ
jgi:hypothetical protein